MTRTAKRPGYVFLIAVLVIGMIASTTAVSLLLLGWAAEQNGFVLMQSAQSYEYAQACAERALYSLRTDAAYPGDETLTYDQGSCHIFTIGGAGSSDRIICVEGSSGDSVRRIEMHISELYPSAVVDTWEEVADFTLCV